MSIASSTEEERWPNEPGFRAVLQGNSGRRGTSTQVGGNGCSEFSNNANNDYNNIADVGRVNPSTANATQGGYDVIHRNKKRLATPLDDDDDDLLLRYVNNINLLSPLDSSSAYVAAV